MWFFFLFASITNSLTSKLKEHERSTGGQEWYVKLLFPLKLKKKEHLNQWKWDENIDIKKILVI